MSLPETLLTTARWQGLTEHTRDSGLAPFRRSSTWPRPWLLSLRVARYTLLILRREAQTNCFQTLPRLRGSHLHRVHRMRKAPGTGCVGYVPVHRVRRVHLDDASGRSRAGRDRKDAGCLRTRTPARLAGRQSAAALLQRTVGPVVVHHWTTELQRRSNADRGALTRAHRHRLPVYWRYAKRCGSRRVTGTARTAEGDDAC